MYVRMKRSCSTSPSCLKHTTDQQLYHRLFVLSIITLMIIENWALWLASGFASSRYNHSAVIITRLAAFKMVARFGDVSESEIEQLKENAVPQKTNMLQNLESSYSKVGWYISLLQVTQFTEKWMFVNFCKIFCSTEWFQQQQSSQRK